MLFPRELSEGDEPTRVAKHCNFMVGNMRPETWVAMGPNLHAEIRVGPDVGCVAIFNDRGAEAVRRAATRVEGADPVQHALVDAAEAGVPFPQRLVELGRLGEAATDHVEFSQDTVWVEGRRWLLFWLAFTKEPVVLRPGDPRIRTTALPYFDETALVRAITTALTSGVIGAQSARFSVPRRS